MHFMQPDVQYISLKHVPVVGLIGRVIVMQLYIWAGRYFTFHLGSKDVGEFMKL